MLSQYRALQKKVLGREKLSNEDLDFLKNFCDKQTYADVTRQFESRNENVLYDTIQHILIKTDVNFDLLFDVISERMKARVNLEKIPTNERLEYWQWSFLAEAAIHAYKYSKQERFIEVLWNSFSNVIKIRDYERKKFDVIRNRSLYSWGRADHIPEGWTCVVTAAGRIGFPVCRMIQIIENDPSLKRKYSTKEYLVAIEAAVQEFDDEFVVYQDEGFYYRPTREDVEPLNHALSVGRTIIELYKITRKQEYLDKATRLAKFFKRSLLTDENGSYSWPYRATIENRDKIIKTKRGRGYPNLVWKSDVDLSFAVLAYEQGIEFTKSDIGNFVRTFTENVYLGNNQFNTYISRNKILPLEEKIEKKGKALYGLLTWMQLCYFEPKVRSILEDALVTRTDMFADGWFGTDRAVLAYAQRLLATYHRNDE